MNVGTTAKDTVPYLAQEYADLFVLAMTLIAVILPLAIERDLLDSIVALYAIPIAFGAVCIVRESIEFVKWLDSKMSV